MQACKDAGDPFGASVWDSTQLAFKVSMNSVYGFLGASKGMLPCVPIAAAVTATGRSMIETTKSMAERLVPGSEVIYGDSVAGYTPLFVSDTARCTVTTFDELAKDLTWTVRADGKETAETCGLDVWSDRGWTRLERLIRHAYDPAKGLVRVLTRTGLVDVTPDHSLLDASGRPVRPTDVSPNDELLHADPPTSFCAPAETTCAFNGSVIVMTSHKDAALVVAHMVTRNVSVTLGDDDDDLGVVRIFLNGSTMPKNRVISTRSIAYSGTHVYDATTANHHFAAGVGRLVVHNTDSVMVRFNVAEPLRHDLREHFRVAQWVAEEITKTFPGCVELEFEKIYKPYLLYSKKRYAGLMYTNPDAHDYIDVKGLQLVRRDNAPIVKKVSQAILDAIMYDASVDDAVRVAQDAVLRVLRKEEPIESFVVSKSLRGSYANPNAQPHVQVARKIKQRTGESIGSGTRVPYVFVVDDNIDELISRRAEDPAYVAEHGLDLDYLYYIDNQLTNPIQALLEIMVDDPVERVMGRQEIRDIVGGMRASRTTLVRDVKRVKTNQKNHQREITQYFQPR